MKYDFNVLKEISVTDSFLSLNKEIRGCQEESFGDCVARTMKTSFLKECQCLPFQLRFSKEVAVNISN